MCMPPCESSDSGCGSGRCVRGVVIEDRRQTPDPRRGQKKLHKMYIDLDWRYVPRRVASAHDSQGGVHLPRGSLQEPVTAGPRYTGA